MDGLLLRMKGKGGGQQDDPILSKSSINSPLLWLCHFLSITSAVGGVYSFVDPIIKNENYANYMFLTHNI